MASLSPLDSTQPPDSQSVALGAQAIRTLTANLDEMLGQIFDSNFNFLTGWITPAILGSGAVTPPALAPGAVTAPAIAPAAVTTPAIAPGAVTPTQLSFLIPKINYGTYAGSNSVAAVVAGLPFAPQVVLITGGPTVSGCGIAFLTEAPTLTGPIHSLFTDFNSPYANAITFTASGFTINTSNFYLNQGGVNHSYVALG